MTDSFIDQHLGALRHIEVTILAVHRKHPELLDYDVEGALDALIARYTAEQRGRTLLAPSLPGPRQAVFDTVGEACEWELGRAADPEDRPETPLSVDEVTACLKRIRKSVQRWTREAGRRGYLGFVGRYVH